MVTTLIMMVVSWWAGVGSRDDGHDVKKKGSGAA